MTRSFWRISAVALVSAMLNAAPARAAEIALVSTAAFRGQLDLLIPEFTKTTGHHVTIWLSTGPAVLNRINSDAPCDVVVVIAFQFDALVKSGAGEAGSSATMGNLTVDLAYPAGSPKPDISTPEKLATLLGNTHAISVEDPALGGVSATYFEDVLKKLGIADAVNAKLVKTPREDGAKPVGTGKAAIGIGISSAVADASGTEGEPLDPTEPKRTVTLVVGTMAKAQDAAAAKALVAFLASPQAMEVIRHRGFTAP